MSDQKREKAAVEIHPDGIIGSVEHNPDPRTERGRRRRAANHPEGISASHPAWKEGGLLCNTKPKEPRLPTTGSTPPEKEVKE